MKDSVQLHPSLKLYYRFRRSTVCTRKPKGCNDLKKSFNLLYNYFFFYFTFNRPYTTSSNCTQIRYSLMWLDEHRARIRVSYVRMFGKLRKVVNEISFNAKTMNVCHVSLIDSCGFLIASTLYKVIVQDVVHRRKL